MKVYSPSDVMSLVRPVSKRKRENFGIICVDFQNNLIAKKLMFMGTVSSCIVGKRELLVYALKKDATGIILFHNHPSGDSTPSEEDIETTNEIKKACKLVGIQLLDHVIVSRYEFSSLKELDLLEEEEKEIKKVAE